MRPEATATAALVLWLTLAAGTGARSQSPYADTAVTDVDTVRVPAAAFVGAQVCRPCHPGAWRAWLADPHARAWVFLATAASDSVARLIEGGPVRDPGRSARCLTCHGSAADVPPDSLDAAFRLQDGVQCEGCHGPGSMHVKEGLIVAGQALRASRMLVPDEAACRACHRQELPSHNWMGRRPFDYDKAKARIDHPTTRQERLEVLRAQPGAYASIGLRTVLGHLFGS